MTKRSDPESESYDDLVRRTMSEIDANFDEQPKKPNGAGSERDAIAKLAQGDIDAFIKCAQANHLFPLDDASIKALAKLKKAQPKDWERLRASLPRKVSRTALDRLIKVEIASGRKRKNQDQGQAFQTTRRDLATRDNGAEDDSSTEEANTDPQDDGASAGFADIEEEGPGFSMTGNGLFWRDDEGRYTWLSQPFIVLGHCRTAPDTRGLTNDWSLLIRFPNKDRALRDEIVSRERLHADLGALCGSLEGAGMDVAADDRERKLFRRYLLRVPSDDRVTLARTLGWNVVCNERAFVLSNGRVISAHDLRERVEPVFASGKHESRGTLDQWREGAGRMAGGHKLGILAVSVSFAGPLLWLGGFESGGVHYCGRSSIGKTTHQRLSCSVWGSGSDGGYLKTWRTTSNAMEAVLAGASDTVLVLDEIEQVNEAEIGAIIYMITGGTGKQRLRRDASWREPPQWRALILSSGESPIETKLTESKGGRARAGHLVRVIDIPAECNPGTAFDGGVGFDANEFVTTVKRETSAHYGTAGPAFVEALIDNKINRSQLRDRVDAFAHEVIAGAHGQAERVAERLGVIAAAGELAAAFGIAPWAMGAATEAAKWAFSQWLTKRGGTKPFEEQDAVRTVRRFIENYGESRFDAIVTTSRQTSSTDPGLDHGWKSSAVRAGYRKGEGLNRRWLVFPEVWRTEVCAGLDHESVARTLERLGMLERQAPSLMKLARTPEGRLWFYVLTPKILEG
jgi:uncharacterized protein (DUF927 family)